MTITIQDIKDWTLGRAKDEVRLAIEADLRGPDSIVHEYLEWVGGEPNRPTPRLVREDLDAISPLMRTALEAFSIDDEETAVEVLGGHDVSPGPGTPPPQSTDDATPNAPPSPTEEQVVFQHPAGQVGPPPARPLHLLDPENERLLQTALKADVPTLLAAIGYFVDRARVALAPPDRQQLRATGEAWLAGRQGELGALLRQDPATWTLLSSAESEISDVPGAARRIVELILPACGEIPATHVAVLLIKRKLGG
jgi:hypothetical protein